MNLEYFIAKRLVTSKNYKSSISAPIIKIAIIAIAIGIIMMIISIATGVGKTRLMGACIAYLYLEKGVRNFFILAPNLTIYEKLIRDFGDPSYHKYVFNGIAEFVHNRPVIIQHRNRVMETAYAA